MSINPSASSGAATQGIHDIDEEGHLEGEPGDRAATLGRAPEGAGDIPTERVDKAEAGLIGPLKITTETGEKVDHHGGEGKRMFQRATEDRVQFQATSIEESV